VVQRISPLFVEIGVPKLIAYTRDFFFTDVAPLDVPVYNNADTGTGRRTSRLLYTPIRMRSHMETTMWNLEAGIASWDADKGRS